MKKINKFISRTLGKILLMLLTVIAVIVFSLITIGLGLMIILCIVACILCLGLIIFMALPFAPWKEILALLDTEKDKKAKEKNQSKERKE